ncbi:MAG: hypothetical protein ACXU82_05420 [Caulobacteraceae bacterium]
MSSTCCGAAATATVGAVAVALALAGCGQPGSPTDGPAPTALAKADPLIEAVQPTPKGVRVIARYPTPDVAGDSVRAASRVARQIARAVQAGAKDLPAGATVITLDLYGVDVDKFGKRTGGRFFETDFDVGDLTGLDLKAKGPAAVLNTAIDLRIDTAGIDPINAWCMRYPHVGGEWCTMAGD